MELATLTNGHPLCAVGWAVCERHGLRHSLGLSSDKLMRLLQRVEEGYNSCAYHNATHAACVTHGVYSLLTTRPELAELFGSPLDLFTLTLAAWVHDLGHTGQNNAYHVATGSGLALQYSEKVRVCFGKEGKKKGTQTLRPAAPSSRSAMMHNLKT